jgi:hypothetical protein
LEAESTEPELVLDSNFETRVRRSKRKAKLNGKKDLERMRKQ